jgi:SHS2 domain-containing protein
MTLKNSIEEVDHTADQAIRIHAVTLPRLFVLAVRGMYDVMGITYSRDEVRSLSLKITADDNEGLLVNFLSEILIAIETKQKVLIVDVVKVRNHILYVVGKQNVILTQSKAIKAITYHDLLIEKTNNGWQTTITFDV